MNPQTPHLSLSLSLCAIHLVQLYDALCKSCPVLKLTRSVASSSSSTLPNYCSTQPLYHFYTPKSTSHGVAPHWQHQCNMIASSTFLGSPSVVCLFVSLFVCVFVFGHILLPRDHPLPLSILPLSPLSLSPSKNNYTFADYCEDDYSVNYKSLISL